MSAKTFPILYHKGKKDSLYSWRVWAEGGVVYTEYGLIDGKKQISKKKSKPKNVGRSNATTAEEQAILEAQSLWTYKRDRKYRETQKEAMEDVLRIPMLAQDFEKKKHKLVYPVTVQPKLDGVRCTVERTFEGGVMLSSRSAKEYDVAHIAQQMSMFLPDNCVTDGELYIHGVPLQTITSYVKKPKPESLDLQYHIYDVPYWDLDDAPWKERIEWIKTLKEAVSHMLVPKIRFVSTVVARSEEEVRKIMSHYVARGYEGAIVRSYEGTYRWGYRSNHLLKVKDFQDAEYEIIGFTSGKGKFEDAVIWICRTPEGGEFNVVPRGTMEYRRELFAEGEKHVGRMLKVKYFALTNDGIPQFPVGLAFRLEEDR